MDRKMGIPRGLLLKIKICFLHCEIIITMTDLKKVF